MPVIRLLLVDDQRLMREGIATLLSVESDLTMVGEAADGIEAIEQVATHRPDVVLMDLRMPRMGGVEATRRIRQDHAGTQVIVLTTFEEEADVFEALRAGAIGYLLKDCPASDLARAIRLAAQGETLLHPKVASKVVAELNRLRPHQSRPNLTLPEPLTEREIELLERITAGESNREIATGLHLAEGTVKNYVSTLLAKLGVPDRGRAAAKARQLGLVR